MDTVPPTIVPGLQLTPTLRLVSELGRGGMGCVWVADHLTLRSRVAVKFLAAHATGKPEAVARFSIEATAAARIRSPHVVQVFDHGLAEGVPYIVMELLEGEDLAQRLKRERRIAPAETVVLVRQICKALERAHPIGIVHRDIKPGNVFLVAGMGETYVKVLDFGLAKHEGGAMSAMTGSGTVFGTPHYVSPEQAESSREATPQSDLWSVAVVAYECLTGRRPFDGHNLMSLCIALHEVRYVPATKVCPGLPAALDAWFARAFQHEPQRRFASAGEMARALEQALAGAKEVTTALDESAPAAVHSRASWARTLGGSRNAGRPLAWVWGLAAAAAMAAGALFVQRVASAPPATATATANRAAPSASGALTPEPFASATAPSPEPLASATTPPPVPTVVAAHPARLVLPSPHPSASPAPSQELFTSPKN